MSRQSIHYRQCLAYLRGQFYVKYRLDGNPNPEVIAPKLATEDAVHMVAALSDRTVTEVANDVCLYRNSPN